MASMVRRAHGTGAYRAGRALAFTVIGLAALSRTGFYPSAAPAIALAIGGLTLLSPAASIAAFVVAMALPLMAADMVFGAAFLVVGLAAVQYLGRDGARPFVLVGLVFVASLFEVEWAIVVLGGFLLGATEGATTALLACIALELAGVALGAPTMGVTATGGNEAVVDLTAVPASPLSLGWLLPDLKAADPSRLLASLKSSGPVLPLVVQPVVWAVTAALAGIAGRRIRPGRLRPVKAAGVTAASVMALAVFLAASSSALGMPLEPSSALVAGLRAALLAAAAAALFEALLPLRVELPEVHPRSMRSEDADVDELLSLIASAEEELASKHTVDAVVMITDMKAFSAMTEEEGSVTSAKRIQRHRDLLLPVIERHGGRGKSTGGDGLVAAFTDPCEALLASLEMQRTLEGHNDRHPGERDLLIRIGISQGEVVLDRGGRPFIGSGLNKAARVMNLGDGGQVLVSADVVASAGRSAPPNRKLGSYELKNIPGAVEVLEILWQTPSEMAAGA